MQAGGARALAVASGKRLAILPDVPTSAEAGIPSYIASGWIALLAPRDTPRQIIDKLNTELNAAMADPMILQRFADLGAEPDSGPPEKLTGFIVSETVKWREITTRGGVQMAQ